MAREKQIGANPIVRELFQFGVYKRSQGRVTRQVTFAVLAATVVIGAWRLSVTMAGSTQAMQYGLPLLVVGVGLWLAYRAVNLPRFADFLIAVEAEMNKVSWPTRDMLFRSSAVVMFTIFSLAFILFAYDIIWSWLLGQLGVSS